MLPGRGQDEVGATLPPTRAASLTAVLGADCAQGREQPAQSVPRVDRSLGTRAAAQRAVPAGSEAPCCELWSGPWRRRAGVGCSPCQRQRDPVS